MGLKVLRAGKLGVPVESLDPVERRLRYVPVSDEIDVVASSMGNANIPLSRAHWENGAALAAHVICSFECFSPEEGDPSVRG